MFAESAHKPFARVVLRSFCHVFVASLFVCLAKISSRNIRLSLLLIRVGDPGSVFVSRTVEGEALVGLKSYHSLAWVNFLGLQDKYFGVKMHDKWRNRELYVMLVCPGQTFLPYRLKLPALLIQIPYFTANFLYYLLTRNTSCSC